MAGTPQPKSSEPLPGDGRCVRDADVRCMPDESLHLPFVHDVLEREKATPGALLPILHAIQDGVAKKGDSRRSFGQRAER